MKVDVDYEKVHAAVQKLRFGESLTREEQKAALAVLQACENDYYPSPASYAMQVERQRVMGLLDYDKDRNHYEALEGLCDIYESKFC